ncbi:hypothetical protein [Anaeromyxobacter sp. PSR-1]|uniref:hypothetical protein n=1 Tax=unclassified Anaeromyxobacter TaxID=2620896 RepID=UPI0005E8B7A2|nr:hypothetical protein [Anaeromyxobacter sp. PSR-1]GAO02510.1 hypothetical protein PSR1_01382 [Anaeromyxobacter sp. PSR-1]
MPKNPDLMVTIEEKDRPAVTAVELATSRPFGLESVSPELAAKRQATAAELVATLSKLLDLLQRAHRESFLSESSIQHMQAVERWYTTLQAEAAQAAPAAVPEKTAI